MMKKTTICSVFIVGILILQACSNDTNSDLNRPFYGFDDSDQNQLVKYTYEIGQIITYRNQFGEQLRFKVISSEHKKRGFYSRGSFSGGGGHLLHYYDSKIIRFKIIENHSSSDLDFENHSSADLDLVRYVFSKSDDNFKMGIHFPLWNVFSAAVIDNAFNPANITIPFLNEADNPTTKKVVNGHQFEGVTIVESHSDEVWTDFLYGGLVPNVNRIYYDYDFGIIAFDSLNGEKWEVIYPD